MIKKILNRRIPQILGSYFIAGTSLVLFIEYLVEKYEFPIYLPTMSLIALVGILPSVLILAYFHGAPGKDEWNKIEKVGIPINVLFIGIFILFGNKYNWWLDNVTVHDNVEIKSIMLANVSSMKSLSELVVHIYELVEYAEISEDVNLELLSQSDLDDIYDEFLSYTEKHKFAEKMLIKNIYNIEERYKREGKPAPKYNFVAVKRMMETLFGINKEDFFKGVLNSLWEDSLSIGSYSANIAETDFGYFPVIFKINSSKSQYLNKYLIWNALFFNNNGNWTVRGEASISPEQNIVQTMHSALNHKINTLLATNHGMITSINDKEILIKFDPQNSRPLKERMMYDVKRKYTFP